MKTPEVVSFSSEELVLVDSNDRECGFASKADAHMGEGRLHRAFSVFLFDRHGRLLLHQRSAHKPLWPGYWTNSCCSHPRRGEQLDAAVRRRLREELGCAASMLQRVGSFEYHARYRDLGSEHELCHIYLARVDSPGEVHAHALEIADLRWVGVSEVDALMGEERTDLSPWFREEWALLRETYAAELDAFVAEALAPGAPADPDPSRPPELTA
ncbi:MAG: isopentenyl-diphosphate Delta-isomerase [Halieaceae bacterium]|nr:isopentenyl-diphosphate Delta-isomerase [Halieaceae bacterium]